MIVQRIPQIHVLHDLHVVFGTSLEDLVAALAEFLGSGDLDVDFAVHQGSGVLIGSDGSVGIDQDAAAAELDGALETVSVGFKDINTVVIGACQPVGSGCLFCQPVTDVDDDVRGAQALQSGGLDEVDIHADGEADVSDGGLKDLEIVVAFLCPLGLCDVLMVFAVDTDDALGTDQGGRIVVDVCFRVDFRHAYDDIAVILGSDGLEAVCGLSGNGLYIGSDFFSVVPAISGGGHFRSCNEACAVLCCLFDQGELFGYVPFDFPELGINRQGSHFVLCAFRHFGTSNLDTHLFSSFFRINQMIVQLVGKSTFRVLFVGSSDSSAALC